MQRSPLLRTSLRRAVAVAVGCAAVPRARPAAKTVTAANVPMVQRFEMGGVRFYSAGGHEEPQTRSGQYLLDKNDVLARVLEVVKNFEKVDASKVTPESHFVNDLGLNSLDVVEVVFAIEQEFILDIPDHDAEKIQSIPDAVEYIAQNPMAK